MRIVHVTPYYAPAWVYGGVVQAVYSLATAQAATGHSVIVLTTDTLAPKTRIAIRREAIDGVEVIRCRNLIGLLRRVNLSTPIGFRRALAGLNPEVIHCHELRTVENLLVCIETKKRAVPIVVTPHGTLPLNTGRSFVKRAWDSLFGARLAQCFNGVIALTETEALDARVWWSRFGHVPPIAVIPNGVDVPESMPVRDNHTSNSPVVLFLGRLHERKGVHLLIPAFAQAIKQAKLPEARLLIVGPDEGMLSRLRSLAEECGIADRVEFAGFLSGSAKEAALDRADFFVLPAVGEGLSVAALEAMAAGLPVILTPGCNLPEVEPRGAGLVVLREVPALAEGIAILLSDPARRKTMGMIGRAWMRGSFSRAALAEQTIAFYQETSI